MSSSLWVFIVRRIAIAPITLFAVLLVTFALTQVAPGDPVRIITGQRTPDPERAELIREEFGLNGSFAERFGNYVVGFVQGDLGLSYFNRSPQRTVQELLGERIWVSAQLGLISLALTYLLGIPLGVFAALHRGDWKDPGLIGGLMVFSAIPSLVFLPLFAWLLVFQLDAVFLLFGFDIPAVWVPGDPASYLIPVVVLTLPGLAGMARFVRVSAPPSTGTGCATPCCRSPPSWGSASSASSAARSSSRRSTACPASAPSSSSRCCSATSTSCSASRCSSPRC